MAAREHKVIVSATDMAKAFNMNMNSTPLMILYLEKIFQDFQT